MLVELLRSLPPDDWETQTVSPRWKVKDVAAVNKPGIMTRELYYPVLDCFLRALPFRYRNVPAKPGTLVEIIVAGERGGIWYLYRSEDSSQLTAEPYDEAVSQVAITQKLPSRLHPKTIHP